LGQTLQIAMECLITRLHLFVHFISLDRLSYYYLLPTLAVDDFGEQLRILISTFTTIITLDIANFGTSYFILLSKNQSSLVL